MTQGSSAHGFGGFFQLKTPQDLLSKLRRDYARVLREPINTDCAFDFFVTANHMVDWIWPSDAGAQREGRKRDPVLRVCAHLADGAKHFLLNSPHGGVSSIDVNEGAFLDAFDSDAFQVHDELCVMLDQTEASELGAERWSVPALAKHVLNYWERRLGQSLTT